MMVELMSVPKSKLMTVGMMSQLLTVEVLTQFKLTRILTMVVLSESQFKKEMVQSQSQLMMKKVLSMSE